MIEFSKAAAVAGVLILALCDGSANAQTTSEPKDRANKPPSAAVGVIAGAIGSTDLRLAADIAAVLDDESLRILPILGRGSGQNLADLMAARPGIDIGIVQSDVLAAARRDNAFAGVERNLQYIAKLHNGELHVLARRDIARLEDLAGKRVNFDLRGSGSFVTGSLVFDALKLDVERLSLDQATALDKLRKGEIAALLYVTGKPARFFRDLRPEDGLHLVPVPLTPELLQTYMPSRVTRDDYPSLVAEGESVDTVAVGAVMAVANAAPNTERYRNVAQFVDSFFGKFAGLLEASRHPKWHEVNLAAQLPGWTRFPPAEEWLRRKAQFAEALAPAEVRRAFEVFIEERAKSRGGRAPTAQERDALFEQFLHWQQARQR